MSGLKRCGSIFRRVATTLALLGMALLPRVSSAQLLDTFRNPEVSGLQFGSALAVVGGKLVVGDRAVFEPDGNELGAVHVFDIATGALLRSIKTGVPDDGFGGSVVADGDSVLVGASNAPFGMAAGVGAVFRVDPNTGATLATFVNPSGQPSEGFGDSIATDGVRVAVTAKWASLGVGPASGAVYVFDSASAALLYRLTSPDPTNQIQFGYSVAFAGGRLIVGQPYTRLANGALFVFDPSSGELVSTILADPSTGDAFGAILAPFGNSLAVGAPSGPGHGTVSIIDIPSYSIVTTIQSPFSADYFGSAVAFLDDRRLIVSTGQKIYVIDATSGTPLQSLTRPGPTASDFGFGTAVAGFGGNELVVDRDAFDQFIQDRIGAVFLFGNCATQGDGASCDDGNLCTTGDICRQGACISIGSLACPARNDCWNEGVCAPLFGCVPQLKPEGTLCDTGGNTTCPEPDTCHNGECLPGGGGDDDADKLCALIDNCPGTANPDQKDTDGDGSGDACDMVDGKLVILQVRSRSQSHGRTDTRVTGQFLTRPPADRFDSGEGLRLQLTDASGRFGQGEFWDPAECSSSPSGAVVCHARRSYGSTDAIFRPLASTRPDAVVFQFTARLRRQEDIGGAAPPVQVILTNSPGIEILGTDRSGQVQACKVRGRTTTCTPEPR